jgi:hypothetical protein
VPEKVQPVLDKTFDRMLLQYNEECDEERVRDAAKHMLQTAKALVPLVDTAGDAKVWSSDRGAGASQAGVKMTVPAIACLIGGILFLAGAVLGLAGSAGEGLKLSALLGSIPAAILGGALLFFAGRSAFSGNAGKGSGADTSDRQVEIRVEPEKVWGCLRALVLSMDKSLREVGEMAAYEKQQINASQESVTSEETELLSGVLESAYCRREEEPGDDSAQEMISQIRYYLHCRQIEVVDYGGGKREWFELLPGGTMTTLRPALVRDGTLIRKGLAVAGQ